MDNIKIGEWLKSLLRSRYPHRKVIVDVTQGLLSSWLSDNCLMSYFPEGNTFNFKTTISGVAWSKEEANLYLVKTCRNKISIKSLSEFIIYPIIAKPYRAMIISPSGANSTLSKLITVYGRIDVLNYKEKISKDSIIRICRWDSSTNNIDYNSTLPYGYHP